MLLLDKPKIYNTFETLKADFFIAGENGIITHIGFARHFYPQHWVLDSSAYKNEIASLIAFFNGEQKALKINFSLEGTDFQKKVWQTIATIPYGETRSYKEVAIMSGHPNAARAVGNACNKNRLLLAIPCHRVVAANGIGGYGGNLEAKRWLLDIEKTNLEEDNHASNL